MVFFGGKRKSEGAEKNANYLMRYKDNKWTEAKLPPLKEDMVLMNFQVAGGKLNLLYGEGNSKTRKIDMYFSSTSDLKNWSKPALLIEGLTPEDVLMQIPPQLIVRGKSIMASFADIYGSWTKGEFKYRVFASDDAGKTWFEPQGPKEWEDKAPCLVMLASHGNDIFAMTGVGHFRDPKIKFWKFSK